MAIYIYVKTIFLLFELNAENVPSAQYAQKWEGNDFYVQSFVHRVTGVNNYPAIYNFEQRETNLMPLVLLLLYSALNMFRVLIHPSVCRLQPAYGYHINIATLQRNTNTHRTRYNP